MSIQDAGQTGQLKVCERALTSAEHSDCLPLAEINLVSLLENYLNLFLHGVLGRHLPKVFTTIKKFIWTKLDPAFKLVKNSIVIAVGSIPFVGGLLASAVGILFSVLDVAIKRAVEKALDKVRNLLLNEILKAMVKAIFATGLFTPAALQSSTPYERERLATEMRKAGDAAQKGAQAGAEKAIENEASKAEDAAQKEAKNAEASIEAEGDEVVEGEQEDAQADLDAYEAEDAEDISEDDD